VLDAVLFDLDGTLTDPEEGIVGSFRHALAEVGHPVADHVDLHLDDRPAIRDNFTATACPTTCTTRPWWPSGPVTWRWDCSRPSSIVGVIEVLDALVADGVRWRWPRPSRCPSRPCTTLEHFGIADRFTVVAGGVADGIPRSKSVIVADALTQLGYQLGWRPLPTGVAMVGDRRTTSTAAGTTAAPPWPSRGASPRRASWTRWPPTTGCTPRRAARRAPPTRLTG
jgi:phosphoglycolate phosphatase